MSHLLQMRGLKQHATKISNPKKKSHLLQMRGLKRETDAKVNLSEVASFTDAWIETADNTEEYQPPFSRIFYRCVDWNRHGAGVFSQCRRRIFYRCVDWNFFGGISLNIFSVASFTDAWIETTKGMMIQLFRKSRIFYRCVDWNSGYTGSSAGIPLSHLLQMRGLKHVYGTRCGYKS